MSLLGYTYLRLRYPYTRFWNKARSIALLGHQDSNLELKDQNLLICQLIYGPSVSASLGFRSTNLG